MCHAAEYVRAASALTIPAAGAWIDGSVDLTGKLTQSGGPGFGRFLGNCVSWTNTNTSGVALTPDGGITTIAACGTPRPIACCM
jgi:hypothetical protein